MYPLPREAMITYREDNNGPVKAPELPTAAVPEGPHKSVGGLHGVL